MAKVFRLDHVTKTYKNDGKEFTALQDVSLSIEEGEIFGIIGMSGAGKSTLVRTLNRLEEVSGGSVSFYGEELAGLNAPQLRKVRQKIAMIFQGFNLLQQRTVLSNVMQPLRIAGVPRVDRKDKALTSRISSLPDFQADRDSVWPSPGLWLRIPKSSSVTRRPALWIPR